MIKTDVRDLIKRLYQTAREVHPESQEVFKHICWEAADLIDSFDQRVADLEDELSKLESKYFTCNQLCDEQGKQIEKLDDTRIEYIGMINKLVDERAKLRKALLAVYDNSLGLDPDKITDDIEWVTVEIRAAREALEDK